MAHNAPPPPPPAHALNDATWMIDNPSPLEFAIYHDMPKNPENLCPKFNANDFNRTAEDHIKMFEDLCNRRVEYGDVACRLFPYSLGEEAYFWFIHLPTRSIRTWDAMKDTFIAKFGIRTTPAKLYRQFVAIRRREHEPITSFNNRFLL